MRGGGERQGEGRKKNGEEGSREEGGGEGKGYCKSNMCIQVKEAWMHCLCPV